MEEQRLQELNAIRDRMMQGMSGYQAINYNSLPQNPVPFENYSSFVNKQNEIETDHKLAKSFYNGSISMINGLIGAGRAIVDRRLQYEAQEGEAAGMAGVGSVTIDELRKPTKLLQRYNVQANTTAEKLIYGLAEGGAQLAGQALVTIATGGIGGGIFMGAQIAGNQYNELRDQGVDPDRAFEASVTNALIQTPMEQLAFGKIMKALPANSKFKAKMYQVLESALTEGLTEGLQSLPEQLTNIWAKNNGIDALGVAREWDKNASDNVKDMVYSGIIGAVLGGGASGIKVAINTKLEKAFTEYQNKDMADSAENAKKNGISAQQAQNEIDMRNRGEITVNLDAQEVLSYAQTQQADITKVAESLGVTTQDIEDAAEAGLDITVSKGHMVQAMMEQNGFSEAMKPNISYGDQGKSLNYYQMQEEMDKAYGEGNEQLKALDEELNKLEQSMIDAGVAKEQAKGQRALANAFAVSLSPDNPAEWLQKNKLRFEDGGKGTAGRKQRGWTQKVWGKSGNSERYKGTVQDYKQAQLEVINQNNKMQDDYHTGIRSVNDILTAKEALDLTQEQLDNYEKEGYSYPDFTLKDGKAAIDSGYITVYSSKEIKPGVFVTPSKMMAADYAGDGTVYSKRIPVKDMAFINADEGNYAPVKQYLQKADAEIKGQFRQADDGTYIIDLFKGADASTVIHETGHYFFEIFMQESGLDTASDKLKKDRAAFLNYVGMTEEQWQAADFEGRRAAHERVATAFEQYLLEGKAPSRGLRGVFSRFSKWLKKIYGEVVQSPDYEEVPDNVRQAFDHWLAADTDLEEAARVNGFYTKIDPKITAVLGEKNKKWLEDKIQAAHDTALEMLTKQYMQNFSAERRAQIEQYRKDMEPTVREAIHKERVNQARANIAEAFTQDVERTFKFKLFSDAKVKYNEHVIGRPIQIANRYINWLNQDASKEAAYQSVKNEIDAALQPEIEKLKEGYGVRSRVAYIDTATGQEISFDEAQSRDKDSPGFVTRFISENAPWYQKWFADNHKQPTQADLLKIAEDLYCGIDEYGVYGDLLKAHSPAQQAEMDAYAKEQRAKLNEWYAERDKLLSENEYVGKKKKPALTDDEALYFESIAEDLGYSSGSEMAEDILKSKSEERMVREALDAEVNAAYPDYLKERTEAELAIIEALNNDKEGEVIALEQQLIEEAAQTAFVKEQTNQARMALANEQKARAEVIADKLMKAMSMGEALNTRKLAMQERRAAANAKKALKEGRFEDASEYKRQQMIAHAMVRHSAQLKQEVERTKKFVKRLLKLKKDKAHFGNESNFNQIAHLLYRLGIERKDYNPNARIQTLQEYLAEMSDKLGEGVPDIDESVINEANDLRDSQNMSIEQYEKIRDALQNLYAIVRQDVKGTLDAEAESFEEELGDWTTALNKLDTVYVPEIGGVDKENKFKRLIVERMSLDSFCNMMDDWTDGYFTRVIMTPLKHCADFESKIKMQYEDEINQALKKWCPTREAMRVASERIYYKELGGTADKHTLINMLIHFGNEGNMRRLCTSRLEGALNSELWVFPDANNNLTQDEAIALTRENILNFLGKYLTKADVEFAQAKVDAANKLWPLLAKVNVDTKGFAPAKVEATPVAFKPSDGDYMTFRGGYYPLARDSRMGSMRQGAEALSGTEDANIQRNTMSTVQSTSKGRTGANYPVKLNFGYENAIIEDTIHDIAYRQVMMNFNKLLSNKDLQGLLKSKIGVEYFNLFRETLWRCARPRSGQDTVMAERTVRDTGSWIKKKIVNAVISCNLKVALQNEGNIFLYGNAVDGFTYSDVMAAVPDMFSGLERHKQMREHCMRLSPFMRERAKAPDFTIKQLQDATNEYNIAKLTSGKANKLIDAADWLEEKSQAFGVRLLEMTDNSTAIPIWNRAFDKKIEQGATEQEAVDFADSVIRRTLGSTRIQDVASVQRGSSIYNLFTAFQGFFNTQFNQWYREYKIDRKLFSEKEYKEAFMRAASFVMSKWVLACLANTVFASLSLIKPFEKDEKKKWSDIEQELITYPIALGTGPIGQAALGIVQPLLGMESYGYRLSIIENFTTKLTSNAYRVRNILEGKKDATELAEPTLEIASIMFGIPLQVLRTGGNIYDAIFNDMSLELEDIMNRRRKSERNKND